ncbi:MAG: cell division protein FtsH, partial [Spirochaetota bacterium]
TGHALVAKLADSKYQRVHKVTIIPRGRALGLAVSLPEKDAYSRGRGWLLDRVKIAYGGYVAEDMFYAETTTGTQNDLQQATDLARRMVTDWGMSDMGPVAYAQEDEPIFLGKEIARHKDYSEHTAQAIDREVTRILTECLNEARAILNEHKDQLERLTAELVEKETLTDAEVREVLGFPESGPVNASDESPGDDTP